MADSVWSQLVLLSPEVLFIFAIFIGWVFSWRRGIAGGLSRTPIDVAVAVLLGAGLISALLSSAPVFSGVWLLGELVVPLLLFYIVASTVRGERDLFRVLWGMMVGLAIISSYHVFSMYQAYGGTALGFETTSIGAFSRFSPVLGNANYAGAILVYLLPAPLAIMARARGGGLGRAIALLVLVMAITSLALSASRGPLLALLAVFAAVFWLMPRARIPILLAGALLALALLPVLQQASQFVVQLRPSLAVPLTGEIGVLSRLYIWQRSLELLAAPLVLGIGPGMFPALGIVYPTTSFVFESAHNDFLNVGVEMGLIGLAAFVAIALLVGRHTYRLLRSQGNSAYKRTLQLVALGLLAFLVVAVTTGVPFINSAGLAAGLIPWALAGLLVGARGPGSATAGPRSQEPE